MIRGIRKRVIAAFIAALVTLVACMSVSATSAAAAPETLFDATVPVVAAQNDAAAVELGVQFRAAVAGQVTGVRFYKGTGNTGTHTGSLWTGTARTRTGTFKGETATGWQTLTFATPVNVTAGTVYTASYFAPKAHYAVDNPYGWPKVSGNLTGIKGVYKYGASSLPTLTFGTSNYWVDVTFVANSPPPTTTPPTTTPPATTTPPGTTTAASTTAATTTATTAATTTTTATAATTTTAPAGLNLPGEPWDGGSQYWAQFPKAAAAGWADVSFFPISVFYAKPSQAAALKALGVNTLMGAEHDGSTMASITDTGMFVLAQDEWAQAEIGTNPKVVGYHVSDECDMGYGGCLDSNDEFGRLAVQQGYVNALRGRNDGRFMQANFGNGVLRSFWAPTTMDDHVALMDTSSVDKYAYTSPDVQWLLTHYSDDWPVGAEPKAAASYGWLEDQMERFQDPAKIKPGWVFVETAKPYLTEAGATTITPTQIEGAVWAAIIHGAKGIAYFQHNNNGTCGNYSLIDCSQALKDKVTAVNAKIASLAPVLNTQTLVWDFTAGVDTMLKQNQGSVYVFAGVGLNQTTGSKTFTLPAGVTGTSVEVIGEARTLPITAGKFTDTFPAESTHHVYRITI